jgi:hypothetical protein
MHPIRLLPVLLAAALVLPACTFVKMGPGADEVSVVALGRALPGCEKRGEVEVSVKDRLGPYERDELRVRDELETLARNEAPSLAADTIQPKAPPVDGAQRFTAWRCAGAAATTPPADPATPDRAQTEPLKDN